jgi:hypothetical protein
MAAESTINRHGVQAMESHSFGQALACFFQQEASMLAALAPDTARDYLRVLWFEGKRNGWPCAVGPMDQLMTQFLAGQIVPARDPVPDAALAAMRATRQILQTALGPTSAAVVADRALAAASEQYPSAREALSALLV